MDLIATLGGTDLLTLSAFDGFLLVIVSAVGFALCDRHVERTASASAFVWSLAAAAVIAWAVEVRGSMLPAGIAGPTLEVAIGTASVSAYWIILALREGFGGASKTGASEPPRGKHRAPAGTSRKPGTLTPATPFVR